MAGGVAISLAYRGEVAGRANDSVGNAVMSADLILLYFTQVKKDGLGSAGMTVTLVWVRTLSASRPPCSGM